MLDITGLTPLMIAAAAGQQTVVQYLLREHKSDVDLQATDAKGVCLLQHAGKIKCISIIPFVCR